MASHLQREVSLIKKQVLTLGKKVSDHVNLAVQGLIERNLTFAEQVIDADKEIDQEEVDLEENCLKLLALYQPVAIDLRFIIAILKINNDLERIGDLAVNIAERSIYLSSNEPVKVLFDFKSMADTTQDMLTQSLQALVDMNVTQSIEICAMDDIVDNNNREMFRQVMVGIREDIQQMESLIHILSASRHLERIADHATNIAEDVIYMINGTIVRHKAEDYR